MHRLLTIPVALSLGAASIAAAAPAMIRIEGGSYTLGTDAGPADERPAHRVKLRAFLIDRTETTNREYAEFLRTLDVRPLRDAPAGQVRPPDVAGADSRRLFERVQRTAGELYIALDDDDVRIGIAGGGFAASPGFDEHPVNEVTWIGALAYCRWRGARLPTEAEWEAAARGRESRTHPWGEQAPNAQRAVFGRRSGETAQVGSRPQGATPEGAMDLAGNVAEWTSTLYHPYPYRADDGREDPLAPGERVTRGGDHVFDSTPERMRSSFRGGYSRAPGSGHRHIGVRCAKSID